MLRSPHIQTRTGFVEAMCVWDCYWFGDIATHGYQAYPETLNFGGPAGIANWAFFPLYPLLIAAVQRLVVAPPATVGAIVSPLLTLAAALGSLAAVRRRPAGLSAVRGAAAGRAVQLLFLDPLFGEPVPAADGRRRSSRLRRRNYVAAGLAGALLSATRTRRGAVRFRGAGAKRGSICAAQRLSELLRRPDMVLGAAAGAVRALRLHGLALSGDRRRAGLPPHPARLGSRIRQSGSSRSGRRSPRPADRCAMPGCWRLPAWPASGSAACWSWQRDRPLRCSARCRWCWR